MWWDLSRMAKTFRDCILSSTSSIVIDSRRDVWMLLAKTFRDCILSSTSSIVISSGEAVEEARLVATGTGMAGGGVE